MPVPATRSKIAAMTLAALCAGLPMATQAEVKRVEPAEKARIEANPVANIYYFGAINQTKIKDLIFAIDEINIKNDNIKKINLYISSNGGDMDSGFSAYWAVKSSPIPISAVNLSVVSSAATMMFCASSDRQSVKGGRFLLHPAAVVSDRSSSYQPNNLARMQQNVQGFNKMFAEIYKTCTNFKPEEIDAILTSEDSRKFILEEEAQSRGIIKGTTEKIAPASLTYYISDSSGMTK